MSTPADLYGEWSALRKTELFKELFRKVKHSVKLNLERSCLSHHTTSSCRAKRAPLVSLNSCGIDTAIRSPDGSGTYVHVHLPHAFYDDDSWGFDYFSPMCTDLATAKKYAALELITTLLSMQPNLLRMPPSAVADPDPLRDAGRKTHQARLASWPDPFESVGIRWRPLVTDESIHVLSARTQHASQYYIPGATDEEILGVLRGWACLQSQQPANACSLPRHAWMYLRSVIPRGGLLEFFERNTDTINHWREGKQILFQFRHAASGAASGVHAEAGVLAIADEQVVDDEHAASGAASSGVHAEAGVPEVPVGWVVDDEHAASGAASSGVDAEAGVPEVPDGHQEMRKTNVEQRGEEGEHTATDDTACGGLGGEDNNTSSNVQGNDGQPPLSRDGAAHGGLGDGGRNRHSNSSFYPPSSNPGARQFLCYENGSERPWANREWTDKEWRAWRESEWRRAESERPWVNCEWTDDEWRAWRESEWRRDASERPWANREWTYYGEWREWRSPQRIPIREWN